MTINEDGTIQWGSAVLNRFFVEYLDEMLFENWAAPPVFDEDRMQEPPQQAENVENAQGRYMNRMMGGAADKGKNKQALNNAMIAYANDNVDAIIQAVVVLVGFLALNFVLHKEREPKTMKALSFSVLCNTVFLLALLLIVKDENVHTLAFCVYVLALGLAVMVYLSQDR
jgi:hypothetical protein